LQPDIRLTPVSYIILGLIELAGGEATPYELKQLVPHTVGHFWTVQHAQVYSEPERLAGAGLLDEEREAGGRRRRLYRLNDSGRDALAAWRAQPTDQLVELRVPGVLQLFFGADPAELAPLQAGAYRRELAELEAIKKGDAGEGPRGPWLALEAGIEASRGAAEFWEDLARRYPPSE
jgi:DNA-binding PadR family transcriptional regulator